MTIYLNDYQKQILKKLLEVSEENNGKKRLHFKKTEIEDIFDYEKQFLYDILFSLKSCRFIDIPFENNLQIDICIYREMIEEQLQINAHYVRRYKDYSKDTLHFSSKPLSETIKEDLTETADIN